MLESIRTNFSADEVSLKLKETMELRYQHAARWCVIQIVAYWFSDMLNNSLISQFSSGFVVIQIISFLLTIGATATFFYYWKKHEDQSDLIWMPLLGVQMKLFYVSIITSLDRDFYTNETATEVLYYFIDSYQISNALTLVVFFQHNMIVLSMVTSPKIRLIFVSTMFIQISFLIFKTQLSHDFEEDRGLLQLAITGFLIINFLTLAILFSYSIYNIMTLSERIILLELQEN